MSSWRKGAGRAIGALAASTLLVASGVLANPGVSAAQAINNNTLVAKAPPDECYYGIGNPSNAYPATVPCPRGSTPKVNQAYVWGLAKAGANLFFGTVANTQCLVLGGMIANSPLPFQTPSYACEFKSSAFKVPPGSQNGTDWRPPKLYRYDVGAKQTIDISGGAAALGLRQTIGIRSAGSFNDVVIFGGPTLDLKAINLFAFKADGTFIGYKTLPQYDDIRQWIVMNGKLYTGVRVTADKTGRVLLWKGTAENPFVFEEVGVTDAEVSYLSSFNGKIYATTWGGANTNTGAASGLWVSPSSNSDRPSISAGTANQWKKIWDVSKYEVDRATAQTLVGGALLTFNNQLYWGLMQIPLTGVEAYRKACPTAPTGQLDTVKAIVGTTRPTPVFRIDADADVNPAKQAQLLYGSRLLGKYNCARKSWSYVPNNAANPIPLMGPAGFGNPFNTYMWAGAVFQNRAYFGTFDWSYLIADALAAMLKDKNLSLPAGYDIDQLANEFNQSASMANRVQLPLKFGADLWRFDSPNMRATAESLDGLSNNLNYGIRTFLVDNNTLWVGMANPMNLKTVPGHPQGGWELRALTPKQGGHDIR